MRVAGYWVAEATTGEFIIYFLNVQTYATGIERPPARLPPFSNPLYHNAHS